VLGGVNWRRWADVCLLSVSMCVSVLGAGGKGVVSVSGKGRIVIANPQVHTPDHVSKISMRQRSGSQCKSEERSKWLEPISESGDVPHACLLTLFFPL
jgi:hypothetical protein